MDNYRCADPNCRKINSGSTQNCVSCSLPKAKSMTYYSSKSGSGGNNRSSGGGNHRNSGGGKFSNSRGGSYNRGRENKDRKESNADLSNPIVAAFAQHAKFLDSRHDQHERLVKLSRDITIESKRVIFLLHRIQGPENKSDILSEAKKKLNDIRFRLWFYVAKELSNVDHPYLFLRAYTAGLQEYIEALSFYNYILTDDLITWAEIQEDLTFNGRRAKSCSKTPEPTTEDPQGVQADPEVKSESEEDPSKSGVQGVEDSIQKLQTHPEEEEKASERQEVEVEIDLSHPKTEKTSCDDIVPDVPKIVVLVPRTDFLLGIADFTGEIMRQAITSASAGKTEVCFKIFGFLQDIHSTFVCLRNTDGSRELGRKTSVLEASLKKVEVVCYNINVRSTEIPKHLIGTYIALQESAQNDPNKPSNDADDNFD